MKRPAKIQPAGVGPVIGGRNGSIGVDGGVNVLADRDSATQRGDAGKLALESINMVSEEKTGISHIKMSLIENERKIMRKVGEEEIEKFAKIAKENPTNPQNKSS